MKRLIIYLTLLLLVVGGCKKYDEGPAISLRSKESRLCREWKLDRIQLNGESLDIIDDYSITEYEKEGRVKTTFNDPEFGEIIYNSNWRFANNNKYLEVSVLEYNEKAYIDQLPQLFKLILEEEWISYEILRLTSKDLFLKYDIGGDKVYRFEYKAY